MSEPIRCDSCFELLEQRTWMDQYDDEQVDVSNQLYVTIEGGYNSFVDTAECVGGKPYQYVLCHACAVRMCIEFGFIDVLAEHSNMVQCPCPGEDLRMAAFDEAVRQQRAS